METTKIISSSFTHNSKIRTVVMNLTPNGRKLFDIYKVKDFDLISEEKQSYCIEHRDFGYKEDMQEVLDILQ